MRTSLVVFLVFSTMSSGKITFARHRLRLAAKQTGFANRDFVQQMPSSLAERAGREVSIIAWSVDRPALSSAGATVGEKVDFLFRFVDARSLYTVADLAVHKINRFALFPGTSGGTNGLGRHNHLAADPTVA